MNIQLTLNVKYTYLNTPILPYCFADKALLELVSQRCRVWDMRLIRGSSSSQCVRGESTNSKRRFALETATWGTRAIDPLPDFWFLVHPFIRLPDLLGPNSPAHHVVGA